ncbi:hypothetical protein TR51_23325 [Kitasatospora griseola]|uniref:Ribonuclease VapC n=1 Tax=Kitasatospora griseola TaxID=2064 RepID=A0A0D0N205_KITGR|nr:PIN domain nuclease [Kitasatospora griseola]KIQ62105.1 hypothetical protein TR51_23325 [Kitasatospora griseola]
MAAELFLIDKSAHARILRPGMADVWTATLLRGQVSICPPTEAEILYSSRSPEDYVRVKRLLSDAYSWALVPDDGWSQVLQLQRKLSDAGQLRSAGIVDLLVAVTAMHHGLTVLHYDRDFETLAQHSELKTRWLAEPGSIA